MSGSVDHTDVGAYALGLLEAEDRTAFEVHLSNCRRCVDDLAELSDMRGLFADVDADAFTSAPELFRPRQAPDTLGAPTPTVFPSSPPVDARDAVADASVVDLGAVRRRRIRRGAFTLGAAAAAAALVVIGVAVGGGFDDRPERTSADSGDVTPTSPPEGLPLVGERHPSRGAVAGIDGVTGVVVVEEKGWGTRVSLRLEGVQGLPTCEMVVVAKDGTREAIGSWKVPETGYGVRAEPAPPTFHGGTAIVRNAIHAVEVRVAGGRTLVTVPV